MKSFFYLDQNGVERDENICHAGEYGLAEFWQDVGRDDWTELKQDADQAGWLEILHSVGTANRTGNLQEIDGQNQEENLQESEDCSQAETENKKIKKDPYTEETADRMTTRILYFCRKKNLNVNSLALRSGLTPSTLKSILSGKSKNPGIVTIRHICDGLNIGLEEFFHGAMFREW